MPAPKDLPLTSFDPRYKDLMLRGAREEFTIPCESAAQAFRLQGSMQSFRARMKKHHGENGKAEWEPLYGCIISLRKSPPSLVLKPRTQMFSSILDKIAPAAPTNMNQSPPLDEWPASESGLTHDPLADFEPEPEQ